MVSTEVTQESQDPEEVAGRKPTDVTSEAVQMSQLNPLDTDETAVTHGNAKAGGTFHPPHK